MTRRKRQLLRSAISILVACVVLFTPSLAHGWGATAHQIIAQIAWDGLNPSTRKKISQLLSEQSPFVIPGMEFVEVSTLPSEIFKEKKISASAEFLRASTWADEIKLDPRFRQYNQQHFIDYMLVLDNVTSVNPPPTPNLVTALNENVKILRSKADAKLQAQALKFIIHFVGDIHQPLHCAVRYDAQFPKGDFGGNRVSIMVADSTGKPQRVSLHAYWDNGLDLFSAPNFTVTSYDKYLTTNYAALAPKSPTDVFDFEGWSKESFSLARDVAYKDINDGTRITVTYKKNAELVVNQQLVKAGFRLAKLLNAIL